MDTSRIDEFIEYVQNFSVLEMKLIKEQTGVCSIDVELETKYQAFVKCTNKLCVEYGENIIVVLFVFRDKIKGCRTMIKKRLDYMLQYDGEKASIYYKVRSCLRHLDKICLRASGHLKKMLDLYGVKKGVLTNAEKDKLTTKHCQSTYVPVTSGDGVKEANDVYYTTSFSDKTLQKVFDYLIKRGCLHTETLLSDFIYYFTGRGEKVNNGLKWDSEIGGKVKLAYFINTIIMGGRDQDKSYWKKAEIIFGVRALGNSYSRSSSNKDNSSNEQLQEDIKKLLK